MEYGVKTIMLTSWPIDSSLIHNQVGTWKRLKHKKEADRKPNTFSGGVWGHECFCISAIEEPNFPDYLIIPFLLLHSLPLSYSWYREDGRPLPKGSQIINRNRVLIIPDAQLDAEGNYVCKCKRPGAVATKVISLQMEGTKSYIRFPSHSKYYHF